MQNKVRFEGTILSEIKLTQYGSLLIRMQNTKEFTKKDGTKGNSSCTMTISADKDVAQQLHTRFKKGDVISVEGNLAKKKMEGITDPNGYEVYDTWIKAYKVDALGAGIETTQGKPRPVQQPITTSARPPIKQQPKPVIQMHTSEAMPAEFNEQYEELPF
jgi:single-stranded DNA-binding protein